MTAIHDTAYHESVGVLRQHGRFPGLGGASRNRFRPTSRVDSTRSKSAIVASDGLYRLVGAAWIAATAIRRRDRLSPLARSGPAL